METRFLSMKFFMAGWFSIRIWKYVFQFCKYAGERGVQKGIFSICNVNLIFDSCKNREHTFGNFLRIRL